MSDPVDLTALLEQIESFGAVAFLVTVDPGGSPHVVSIRCRVDAERIVLRAGSRSMSNIVENPEATLLWPAPPHSGYCLIVDGRARVLTGIPDETVEVTPTSAVLHRTPDGDPSEPSCVTVLERPGR